ncbi:alkaline phosphatase family protein [Microbacterium sp. QXD-8]|uniref:Alkaline phosphatase family protein n=1 Tax=Microbacterium psychrotolerans TaxID=3068321 RepID=A0ABU0Z1P0_9MICO|nr:alkaline phosphatase family protein [Microbacterium sp. QXD-8]MDQ7877766.1 alkaline phosphatase family protein [Microbacterium sp. QXD-8]
MSLSLPADPPRARSLTRVVPQMSAALNGGSEWFAPARSAIVWVIDGLGVSNLAARAGHARFLSEARTKRDTARTVFPSTTAAALTSLLTGALPGEHGIVGYRARVPGTDDVVNMLRGWDTDGLPLSFQRAAPLSATLGRPFFAVSRNEYARTGFTAATLGEAEFHGADDLDERVRVAADLAARHPGSLVYLYAADLDAVGHKRGWESDEWVAALERVDAAARTLAASIDRGTGVVVTSDHGMIDVPRHRHILLDETGELLDGVRLIGGEPRMLQLYTEAGQADAVLARWREAEASRSWVFSRAELEASGLMGAVDPEVGARIGDVIVAPRAGIAYYDDRLADKAPQKMVGQHGSLTDEERVVPLIRLGAFA